MKWTLFNGVKDTNKKDCDGSWGELVSDVRSAGAADSKTDLPMIKLAEFGDDRAGGQSLRNTDNIGRFYGIEADYDEGKVSMQEAFDRLNGAGIRCLLHTSAQHTPEKPRWRVLAPFYEADGETLEVRTTCLNRLNGVLGGILAPESWTPAQCYFIGSLSGGAAQEVLETDDMCGYIDAMAHLDDIAIGAGSRIRQTTVGQRARVAPVPPGTKLAEGDGRREMLKSYGGALRADGADADEIFEAFKEFAGMHFDPEGIDWDNLRALAVWCGGKSTREEMLVAEFEGVAEVTAAPAPKKAKRSRVDWSDYVFVQQENRVMRLSTGGMSTVPAFNAAMQGEDRRVPAANNKTKEVSAITYLMDYKKVPPVFFRMYMPSVGKFFEHGGEPCVNSYQPELVPGADEDWVFSPAWRVVEEHFQTLFEDAHDGELIMDWMAHNVQFPGRKILWAPIIKGTQGDGKSTIRNILTLVMGYQNVRDITHSDLSSSFNAYAEGACVAALEEIRVVGHSRFDVMNALKPLITNEIISVTRKGQDSIQVPNTQNYIGFTNADDALPIDANDRRYGIFYTKYESREQLQADRDEAYWERLHGAYREHVGVIRGWLLGRDLSGFDRLFPPAMSNHKQRMIEDARPQEEQAILEVIDNIGEFFTAEEVVAAARRMGFSGVNSHRVGKVARETKYCKEQLMIDGSRSHYWYSEKCATECKNQAELRHLAKAVRDARATAEFDDDFAQS